VPPKLDGGLNLKDAVDAQDALVVYVNIMTSVQLVPYPAVAHVRVSFMDLLDLVRNSFVLLFMAALQMLQPSVIR
jgi:hypothetical protein